MSEAVLKFSAVTKVFGGAGGGVSGIDLYVPAGDCVAVMGASGCGKTTLLRIAARLESLDGGEVQRGIDGTAEVGVCFQEPRLLPWRTALRNVSLPLELQGVGAREMRERAADALQLVGLAERHDAMPSQLSGGMRMRVGLARALVNKPDVLLLDEPCSALDIVTRMEIEDQVAALRERLGMTLLLVTHSIDEAVFLADRVLILGGSPGRISREIEIDLPSRDPSVRDGEAFGRLMAAVMTGMHSAARKAS